MQIDNLILNSLRNQGQNNNNNNSQVQAAGMNNNVLGTTDQNMNQPVTQPMNQVVNLGSLAGLGLNCCPPSVPGGEVLGTTGRTIEVPEVLGTNEGNTLVEVCIPVVPPGLNILFEFIQKQLVFDALVPAHNKVFINGRLIKIIPFTVCNNNANPATLATNGVVFSNIVAVTVQVPFALCIPVRGAVAGTRAVVLSSTVDEVDLPNLRCPEQQCIRSIVEKDCITVRVKVERDTMITVPATTAGV